jgi:hypothetical protein
MFAAPHQRILLVTHYLPPQPGATQARVSALTEAWAAGGETVTLLAGMRNHRELSLDDENHRMRLAA